MPSCAGISYVHCHENIPWQQSVVSCKTRVGEVGRWEGKFSSSAQNEDVSIKFRRSVFISEDGEDIDLLGGRGIVQSRVEFFRK